MRQKDANQSIKATWLGSCAARTQTATWLGSADTPEGHLRLTEKCLAGSHKAVQYQPDVKVFVQLMRANLHLAKHLRLDMA